MNAKFFRQTIQRKTFSLICSTAEKKKKQLEKFMIAWSIQNCLLVQLNMENFEAIFNVIFFITQFHIKMCTSVL